MEGREHPETGKYVEFVPSMLLSLKAKVTSIMVELGPENKLGGKTVACPLYYSSLCKHSIHHVDLCKKVTKQWPQKMLPAGWGVEGPNGLSLRHRKELSAIFFMSMALSCNI